MLHNYTNTRLIESTINSLIRSQGQAEPQHQIPLDQPNTIVLLFKDQRSTDAVQKDLSELSEKIRRDLCPVFTSRKIIDGIKGVEAKQIFMWPVRYRLCRIHIPSVQIIFFYKPVVRQARDKVLPDIQSVWSDENIFSHLLKKYERMSCFSVIKLF